MSDFLILEMASVFGYLNNIRLDENEKYNAMAIEHEQLIKKLCASLPEDERDEVFRKLDVLHSDMLVMNNDEHFKCGFKLGLTIAAQSLLD